jgi:hypothetical protein
MISALVSLTGAPWDILPPGIHPASLAEVEQMFATNFQRQWSFSGLLKAAQNLRSAGCSRLYLNGSYVTAKPQPGDYDACWEVTGVNPALLDAAFSQGRLAQKAKFLGEFYPVDPANRAFLDFFQREKFTGQFKGIISIDIATDPRLSP